jgi:hypothetical protein
MTTRHMLHFRKPCDNELFKAPEGAFFFFVCRQDTELRAKVLSRPNDGTTAKSNHLGGDVSTPTQW